MTGSELKQIRKAIGWSAAEAARQFSLTAAYWYAQEKAEAVAPRIADFMEMKNKVDVPRIVAAREARAAAEANQPVATPAHLTAFRRAFNLTQDAAASLLGVSRITWNRWENNQSPVPRSMLHTLRGLVQKLKQEQTGE
ncbi:MAG: DUF1870 family protein [Dehalococcoidia bacterium]|jgi:transcriptional regulator with XRE-family HTH domain